MYFVTDIFAQCFNMWNVSAIFFKLQPVIGIIGGTIGMIISTDTSVFFTNFLSN